MKESIYTVPISEVFEPKCGCPMCALAKTLEERWVDYITGAAMMEPDVRIETNRHGFCGRHFDMMLKRRNRLSVALMLQTRLQWINKNLDTPPKQTGMFKKATGTSEPEECFVCSKINREATRIGANVASVWGRESDFRKLFSEQEYLCYPHARLLLDNSAGALKKETLAEYRSSVAALTRKKLDKVQADIDSFCNLFDYRNAGSAKPDENVATAVENAIAYLLSNAQTPNDKNSK